MRYGDHLGFLRKMEEVLRTAPRENDLTGLFIKIPNDTVTNWAEFLREVIADQEIMESDESKQKANFKAETGEEKSETRKNRVHSR